MQTILAYLPLTQKWSWFHMSIFVSSLSTHVSFYFVFILSWWRKKNTWKRRMRRRVDSQLVNPIDYQQPLSFLLTFFLQQQHINFLQNMLQYRYPTNHWSVYEVLYIYISKEEIPWVIDLNSMQKSYIKKNCYWEFIPYIKKIN